MQTSAVKQKDDPVSKEFFTMANNYCKADKDKAGLRRFLIEYQQYLACMLAENTQ